MDQSNQLVVCTLEDQEYALYLKSVERIVNAVEVTALPKAPDIVLGIINMQGKVIPVISIRRRNGLPEREIDLSDQFIITNTSIFTVALLVDNVSYAVEYEEENVINSERITPGIECFDGVIKLKNGLILNEP